MLEGRQSHALVGLHRVETDTNSLLDWNSLTQRKELGCLDDTSCRTQGSLTCPPVQRAKGNRLTVLCLGDSLMLFVISMNFSQCIHSMIGSLCLRTTCPLLFMTCFFTSRVQPSLLHKLHPHTTQAAVCSIWIQISSVLQPQS